MLYFVILCIVGIIALYVLMPSSSGVDYSSEVKPLLNKKCIACHGGVKKSGGISFLFRDEMITEGESGHIAVVPGKPGKSEVIRRITHQDPEVRMPPDGDPLTPEEIDILTRWIEGGAQWGEHWAYESIEKPELPPYPVSAGNTESNTDQWGHNGIDQFVISRLVQEGLYPNESADCASLIRRLSLDLIGLPPAPDLVDQYCANPGEEQYQAVIDTLLNDPAFGEHWASHWLDLARYADTKGFERDAHREIWHYRDWLIRAFNQDMHYDQFTVEQLAGDLLPNPTADQYTATAFHRNSMSNDEGGTDNEEYRVQAIIDRVNTTWGVWLGTTMNCVQCHSHPYDPIRHEDFYTSYAFFNNSRDEDTHHDSPRFRYYQGPDSLQLDSIRNFIRELPGIDEAQRERTEASIVQLLHTTEPKVHPHYFEFLENSAHGDTKTLVMYPEGLVKLPNFLIGQDSLLLISFGGVPDGGTLTIRRDKRDGPLVSEIALSKEYRGRQVFFPVKPQPHAADLYFSYTPAPDQGGNLSIGWMVFYQPPYDNFSDLQPSLTDILNTRGVKSVPVMMEGEGKYQRTTRVFERGNWLVHGDTVQPDVPGVFAESADEPMQDRLDLAQWIVSPQNPLTARVTVNRFWEQLFGRGIVETSEDFGSQGSVPSHPKLLDYLAYEFMHTQQWSVKALLRQIASSATYRQASDVSSSKLEKDPYNILLSRGPRVRLSAEQVRDQTLAVSGLLSKKMYGPPVMPPQPDGIWSVVYNGAQWVPSTGEDRYRRAVYTYWRRTSPYPSMVSFDAPSREFCVVRRIRTNTPLQALVALNDPVFLEAAQAMARSGSQTSDSVDENIQTIFQKAIFRVPTGSELQQLEQVYEDALADYQDDQQAARDLLTPQDQLLFNSVPQETPPPDCAEKDCAELAAMTVVANVILNLDAFITKE
ncbi:hypothetical protein CRP01_03105 [Flavilitoribacter nigricans DSM 23189 = NBRC 102662]|uniref:Cytochrome c domain-containing protein n=1 Tax=Flavilitoribacter nigricans (strain ATCC 23147 / DSM 23189 / NBRC 102662 / NCIMB 1420 / SS-2) TaxID=1122177 RepID=A0A2D0NHX1_FLAN2|nr:hypothetical protein CRP01_03105 [Flavilitoribacter nigricans DSM 23189 = NBRC 102662]